MKAVKAAKERDIMMLFLVSDIQRLELNRWCFKMNRFKRIINVIVLMKCKELCLLRLVHDGKADMYMKGLDN